MTTEKLDTKELFIQLDNTTSELVALASSKNEVVLNKIPFTNSWSAAQVIAHVTKSNNAIAQGLHMQGKPAERNPEEGVPHLKKMFLDFEVKYKSPDFIVPEEKNYNKEELIDALQKSILRLEQARVETDLTEIINLPAFGEVTKLELLHFVLYHTQRHIHQVKKILNLTK